MRVTQWVYAAVGVGAALCALAPWAESLELATIDARAALFPAPEPGVAVVTIGDRTRDSWPEPSLLWGPRYAALVGRLRELGAKGVALDIVVSADPDPYLAPPGPTSKLTQALASWEDGVTLATIIATDGTPVRPLLILELAVEGQVGHINLEVSQDGAHRLVPGSIGSDEAFSAVAARLAGSPEARIRALDEPAREGRAFLRGMTGLPTFEAQDVLSGEAAPDLRGQVVVVAWTFSGNGDALRHPGGALLPGVLLQARAIQAYIEGVALVRAPPGVEAALAALIGAVAGWFTGAAPLRWGRLALVVGAFVWVGAVLVAASRGSLLPVIGVLVALVTVGGVREAAGLIGESVRAFRLDQAFGGSASPLLKEYLLEHGGRLKREPVVVEGVVMFVDLRGSVGLGEGHDPLALKARIDGFLALGVAAVEGAGGALVRFLGDGFVAVFGFPPGEKDASAQAWEAARALFAASAEAGSTLAFGLGMQRGEFVACYTGDRNRLEFTILGDTVNVASRLEGLTKSTELDCDVVAGEDVGPPATGFARVQALEKEVKGRVQPVRLVAYRYHVPSGGD